MKKSIILMADSYKASQWNQYPEGSEYISSYIEARTTNSMSVFFGLQAFMREYLETPITMEDVDFAESIITTHGEPFNREGWEYIVREHDGKLPIEIQAVPEGTVMNTSNVQVQITNTDPACVWLVSYLETAIHRAVWYPSTVATNSFGMKQVIKDALIESSDIPWEETIGFKLHDFGARGATSSESAMLGGMGHLVNFMGTDTIEALIGAKEYYDEPMAGFSIPASEHSTITSWGREGEIDAYRNMIQKFGGEGKIFACVSDSYNIFDALKMWHELEPELLEVGGTLVVRPDSGDPLTVPVNVLEDLWSYFDGTVNSKGYKVLPDHIRVIQGDGLNTETLPKLIKNVLISGFSLDNIAFGMGGGLLQNVNRDTLKYAMKASAIMDKTGTWNDVYKDPIHGGKTSKRGRFGLVYECGLGSCGYRTVPEYIAEEKGLNILETVYMNGLVTKSYTLQEIRDNTQK